MKPKRTSTLSLDTELRNSDGFIGVDMQPARYIGHTGIAVTDLRPAGKVLVDGQTLDAVSALNFLPSGTRVIISRYENAQIYVSPA